MNFQYKIIISNKTVYKEFEIMPDMDKVRLGTTSACEFRLNPAVFFDTIELEFECNNGKWELVCNDSVYMSRGDMRKLLSTELNHGDILTAHYASSGNEVFELRFMIDFDAKVPFFNWKVDLKGYQSYKIGSEADCDLVINSQYSNKCKVELVPQGQKWIINEIVSSFGVYHNGKRIDKSQLVGDYEFFSVEEFSFFFLNGELYFDCKNINLPANAREIEHQTSDFEYPLFNRNTRVKKILSDEPIAILDAPSVPSKPQNNIIVSLLPALLMCGMMAAMYMLMKNQGGGSSIPMMVMMCGSMLIGVMTSVISLFSGKKQYKIDCAERVKKYSEYIDSKKEEVSKARQVEFEDRNEIFSDIQTDVDVALGFDKRLFEKTKEDVDFLEVYIGKGRVKSKRQVDYKEEESLEVGDELLTMPKSIHDMFEYIDDVPVTLPLKDTNGVGVVGTNEQLYMIFKNLLIDISVRHYYGDVRIFTLDESASKISWIKYLPHIVNPNGIRNIVADNKSKSNIFDSLYKELNRRAETKAISYHCVVLVLDEFGIKNHPISRYIENASELGVTFIFFENKLEDIPLHCDYIVELTSDDKGKIYPSEDGTQIQEFSYSTVPDEVATRVAQKLSPVYCEEINLENSLTKSITLFELLHIFTATDLNLKQRWGSSQIYKSMAAPLGVNAKNEVVDLNLHEKFHGPHGLVAGTTGSGKSEILQSYIMSAATIFHPYELGFVIIDFKGGGMVNQFRNLPHLIGAITNIDGNEIQRSLKSIKAELMKRQTLFAEAGVNQIDKYIQLYKNGEVKEALPHLVMIVDEFAELKAEQPDFMKELISAARIGRSLGVHLILATQKPSGVVDDQIWSNSKFKLCLKVQSTEDSNEVLKTPLAAEIKEPGRAYLQVGNNEIFDLFQSAYSGGPASMDESDGGHKEFSINSLNIYGLRNTIFKTQKPKNENLVQKTQLDALVDYIADYCKDNGIVKLPDICLPSLSTNMKYENLMPTRNFSEGIKVVMGMLDDPDRQIQEPFEMNLTSQNVIVIGSGQMGKTNLIQTIIRDISQNYTPEQVNMYILDFGSMILRNFDKMHHVGGVVCMTDDDKLNNLVKLLNEELATRKERLVQAGVSSFAAYLEAGFTDLPQIVVFIDNMTNLKEMYLEDEDFILPLCRDGVAVGISFVVMNSSTNAISYRYLPNFEGKLVLFCNDSGEYSTVIEGCRMQIPNTPGRAMTSIEKKILECQMFLSFDGEKEIERVSAIKDYVEEINTKYPDSIAKRIPEIPEDLTVDFILENYDLSIERDKLIIGLDFETVEPVRFDMRSNVMLGVTGLAEKGRNAFAEYILETLSNSSQYDCELYFFDSLKKKWRDYENNANTAGYTTNIEEAWEHVDQIIEKLDEQYNVLIEEGMEGLDNKPWIILVIENVDMLGEMSEDFMNCDKFKTLYTKYKELNFLMLHTGMENEEISFTAPDFIKDARDYKRFVVFEDCANIKMFDISYNTERKYAKKINENEGYYLLDNNFTKVKTVKI